MLYRNLGWPGNVISIKCVSFTSAEIRVEAPGADGKEEESTEAARCFSQDLCWVFPCHFLTSKTFLVMNYVF